MEQSNLLELAKQGDARAIAELMNRQLQPKGISVKAVVAEGCLKVMLESAAAPPQQKLVSYIRNAMSKLGAASIRKISIYGKQTGSDFPAWHEEFDLQAPEVANKLESSESLQAIVLTPQNKTSETNQDTVLLECVGHSKVLLVEESGVIIKRLGELSNVPSPQSQGERFIPYGDIFNIQLEYPGLNACGFLYFQVRDSKVSSIDQTQAEFNQNAVIYFDDPFGRFYKARTLVAEKTNLPKQSAIIHQPIPKQSTITQQSIQVSSGSHLDTEAPIRCPKCKSAQITGNKKGFSLGQAAAGVVVTGGIGLFAGFLGSNQVRVNCLKCGHRWKPH